MRIVNHPVFRWLVTLILLGLLGYQLWNKSDHFHAFNFDTILRAGWWLGLVVLLMPVNLLLETLKWRTFLAVHVRIPILYMLKAVAGGIAVSLFTPNRIGEFGGRILFVSSNARWPVAISTLMGSFSQNLVAFTAGVISCFFLFKGLFFLKVLGLTLVCVGGFCFFKIKKFLQFISSLNIHPFLKKLVQNLHYVDNYSTELLVRALTFALARYLIYTSQFVLLLHAFEPDIHPGILFLGVSGVYLFQTLVPLPPIADVVARTNIGLIVWSGTGMSELSITLASLMVWLINLLIPAVIGSFALGTIAGVNTLDTHDQFAASPDRPLVVEQSTGT